MALVIVRDVARSIGGPGAQLSRGPEGEPGTPGQAGKLTKEGPAFYRWKAISTASGSNHEGLRAAHAHRRHRSQDPLVLSSGLRLVHAPAPGARPYAGLARRGPRAVLPGERHGHPARARSRRRRPALR